VRAVVLGWIRARWGVSLGDWFGGPTLTNWIYRPATRMIT
jgi:hypothetical protein